MKRKGGWSAGGLHGRAGWEDDGTGRTESVRRWGVRDGRGDGEVDWEEYISKG